MAGDGCNGNGAAAAGVVVPEIKFTKLFINGEFVDAVSGTCLAVPSFPPQPPAGRASIDLHPRASVYTQLLTVAATRRAPPFRKKNTCKLGIN